MAAGSAGRFDAADIRAGIERGQFQAWGAVEDGALLAVGITEIICYPKVRAMRFVGISGHSPRRWMPLLHQVEQVARQAFGCSLMECLHMPGHERLLRTGGWSVFHYLSAKVL
jgi:hypothetical protein